MLFIDCTPEPFTAPHCSEDRCHIRRRQSCANAAWWLCRLWSLAAFCPHLKLFKVSKSASKEKSLGSHSASQSAVHLIRGGLYVTACEKATYRRFSKPTKMAAVRAHCSLKQAVLKGLCSINKNGDSRSAARALITSGALLWLDAGLWWCSIRPGVIQSWRGRRKSKEQSLRRPTMSPL